jgi:hypothetical protein
MKRALPCTALILLAWGCSDSGSGSKVATTVVVTPASVTFDAVGATQVVHASVKDQNGGNMSGASLSWSSSSAAATVAGAGGDSAIVTSAGPGSASITATSGAASGAAAVQVTQVATGLQKVGGDAQTGPAGLALPTQVRVKVVDRLGAAVAGATVGFVPADGSGTVAAATVVSGADGTAATTWTLGTNVLLPQTNTASLAGVATTNFTATAVAGAPASLTMVGGSGNQATLVGTAVAGPPAVRVADAFGNPVAGITVVFTVASGGGSLAGATQVTNNLGVATVGSWTVGSSVGANSVTATVPSLALGTLTFLATAVAEAGGIVSLNAGTNQAAMAGTAVPVKPSVKVRDADGNPIPGRTVTFAVTGGGGSVTGGTTTTNASGIATVGNWILGASGPNTLTATVSGSGVTDNPVTFSAVGCQGGGGSGYAITLCFTTTLTSAQRTVFESAATRWAGLITGDVADLPATIPAGSCGGSSPTLDLTIDDLVIFAGIEPIDGPGAVLGSAGWCYRRTASLPIVGLMRFDAADVANLQASGQFNSVILHEMGHVLGIGSLWSAFGFLQNPQPASGPLLDTYFSGPNGIAGFDAIGGTTYTGGQKVPVENTGGGGTANSHWRETVLNNELMTGFLNAGSNPLSVLTVRSLQDLGYTVNVAGADPFFLTLSLRAPGTAPKGLHLRNDVWTGPRYTIDRQGRRTRLR